MMVSGGRDTLLGQPLSGTEGAMAQASAKAAPAVDREQPANALLSQVTHGVRTPVNVILGTCSLLEHDAEDPTAVREHAAAIVKEGVALLHQLNCMVDMARLRAGEVSVTPVPFEPGQLVAALISDAQSEADACGVDFVADVACDEGVELLGDVSRLAAIGRALLANAFSFTPPGNTVILAVETVARGRDGAVWLRLSVGDSGQGMDRGFATSAFEPFSREVETRVNQVSGLGLGLSVVRGLVELMSGTITVQSEPGEGSLFTVEVPLELAPVRPADAAGPVGLAGLHLLAAEDNPFSAAVLEQLLELEGATTLVVPDGRQALDAFVHSEPGTFDALLLDHNMPVMDGLTASRAIRQCGHPDALSVPIVALTSNSFAEDVAASLDAGMDGHLVKPVRMEPVGEAIAQARVRRMGFCA